jgi:hypothetical protein
MATLGGMKFNSSCGVSQAAQHAMTTVKVTTATARKGFIENS